MTAQHRNSHPRHCHQINTLPTVLENLTANQSQLILHSHPFLPSPCTTMRSIQLFAFALTLFTALSSAGVIRAPEAEAGLNSKPCIGGSKLGCTIKGGRSAIQETEVKIKRSPAPEAELNSEPCTEDSKAGCTGNWAPFDTNPVQGARS
jgi:hypothetical protein